MQIELRKEGGLLARWRLDLRIAKLWLLGSRTEVPGTGSEAAAAAFWSALRARGAVLLRESGSPAYEFSTWYLELEGSVFSVSAEELEPFVVSFPRSPAGSSDPRREAAERAVTEAGRLVHAGSRETRRQAVIPGARRRPGGSSARS